MHASELKLPLILAHVIGLRFAMVSVAFFASDLLRDACALRCIHNVFERIHHHQHPHHDHHQHPHHEHLLPKTS